MTDAEQRRPRHFWPTLVRAGVSAGLLGVLIWQVEFSETLSSLRMANGGLILLLLALFVFERIAVAFRWWVMLPKGKSIPFRTMLKIVWNSSFLGLLLPGTVGFDALRIYGVARSTNDLGMTLASFAAERFFALAALFVLQIVGALIVGMDLVPGMTSLTKFSFAGLVLLAFLALAAMWRPARDGLYWGLGRLLLGVVRERIKRLFAGLDHYRGRPRFLLCIALLALAFQFLRVLQGATAGAAVGIELEIAVWTAIMPFVMLALLLPFSFFGLGLRDLSLVFTLALFGVPPEEAVAAALLLALATVIATLPGAWVFYRHGISGVRSRA